MPGWTEDLTDCREESDLPAAARDYLQFMSDFVGVPIALIGVGPGATRSSGPQAGAGMAVLG